MSPTKGAAVVGLGDARDDSGRMIGSVTRIGVTCNRAARDQRFSQVRQVDG